MSGALTFAFHRFKGRAYLNACARGLRSCVEVPETAGAARAARVFCRGPSAVGLFFPECALPLRLA